MPPSAVSAVAAGSLVAGFAVAELTGVRSLGGLLLVVAATWCAVLVVAAVVGVASLAATGRRVRAGS